MRARRARRTALAGIALVALTSVLPARAEPLRIYAAGSLKNVLDEVISGSGVRAAPPVFGPAGLLRDRLAAGEPADLFLSADLAGPESLVAAGKARQATPFVRNALCVLTRAARHLTPDRLLDALLDPSLRLATSTPEADPGGDYAEAVFRRADRLHPGAAAILEAKALRLLGSPGAMVPVAGRSPAASIFLQDRADALLYYCSGQDSTMGQVAGLALVELPPDLAVPVVYGAALMTPTPDAQRLLAFLVSAPGQAILATHGLVPLGQ